MSYVVPSRIPNTRQRGIIEFSSLNGAQKKQAFDLDLNEKKMDFWKALKYTNSFSWIITSSIYDAKGIRQGISF
jgi:hypothetical protein